MFSQQSNAASRKTRRIARGACAPTFAFLAVILPVSAQQTVTAVRFWSFGDVTRVAIEASGGFGFKSDRLVNPDRIFFDLAGTVPNLDHRGHSTIAVGDTFLRQIRVAETQRGTTRVVLDLQGPPAEVSTSVLENPDRLIIELRRPGSHPAPLPEPVITTSATTPPVEPQRVFHPPAAQNPISQNYERRKPQTPQLEAPMIVVGGQMAANAARNDPLARMPASALPPPPAPSAMPQPTAAYAMPLRTPRSSPGTTLANIPSASTPVQTSLPQPEPLSGARLGLPAKSRSAKEESMIRALGLKVGRIVIDAGHGGHDAGSSGPGGLKEKDLVLAVARLLGTEVEQHLGWEVVYTRGDDTFIPLEQRTAIANSKRADLFLSIHANSSSVRTASGIETYYLNFTTSKAALDVAARENATSEKTIFDLQDLLEKIALKDKVDESREFAQRIESSLFAMSTKTTARARDRGVRKAPFVVLIGASMPSVLAEIGFISNPRDEALMRKPEYRQKIAEALYKGVAAYAQTLSHFQVAQTLE